MINRPRSLKILGTVGLLSLLLFVFKPPADQNNERSTVQSAVAKSHSKEDSASAGHKQLDAEAQKSPSEANNSASTKIAFEKQTPPKTPAIVKEHLFKKGDTLALVLSRLGVSAQDIHAITRASKPVYNLRRIHPGQVLAVTFDGEAREFSHLSYEINDGNRLELRQKDGSFVAVKKEIPLERSIARRAGTITDSLYKSANRFGVPIDVIGKLADIFAWDIDFGNDIRKGDHFNLVYEVLKRNGKRVRGGRVLAAEMTSRGETYRAYYFSPESGRGHYYDQDGRSLRKAFMKSPLRYSHISSGYTRRRLHPILKVNRPHLGIDFAAKRGTRVRAAGDGVIHFVGWKGGNGKTVIIRHKNGYKTLYGHLSSYARGIKKGKKVKQEDFIARVGSTGLSTGPHLHYTLYKNGRAINPRKADVLRGEALPKKWHALFSEQVLRMDDHLYPTLDLLSGTDSL